MDTVAKKAITAALLAALCGAPVMARYAVGDVTVRQGNPVRGVEGGVILRRDFVPPGCWLDPPEPRAAPLSGSLETAVVLEVGIIACPPELPAPVIECGWELAGRTGQEAPTRGWRHFFRVPMPVRTGIYRLTLSCTIDAAEPETFEAVVFVTYAPPRLSVSPPRAIWYERACAWGAGLTAAATEDQVIRAVQRGLFDHGQRFWRYGYCEVDGPLCAFGDIEVPTDAPDLKCCVNLCRPGRCGCLWPAMVDRGSGCSFSDCFVFSDVLRYITATIGIGGFESLEVRGDYEKGFATRAAVRSLDPAFSGNFLCGERRLSCSYLFGNHSLLRRNGTIYDATFGQVYADVLEVFGRNVCRRLGRDSLFADEVLFADFLENGYGVFALYNAVSLSGPMPCSDTEAPVDSGGILFTGRLTALPAPISDVEALAVDVEVEVRRTGEYLIFGGLYDGDRLITRFAVPDFKDAYAEARVKGPPDEYTARLYFSARDLLEAEVAESLNLQVRAYEVGEEDTLLATSTMALPAVAELVQRGRALAAAEQIRANGVDADGDGLYEALRVEVPVAVGPPGAYAVDARLASGGETIAYQGRRLEPETEAATVTLDFAGIAVARAGLDGLYEVTVELHRLDPPKLVHVLTVAIGVWSADQFE